MNKYNLLGIGGLLLGMAVALHSSEVDFPKLTGPYLSQKPPGKTPEIFAPQIISTGMSETLIAVAPDGQEIFYFSEYQNVLLAMVIERATGESYHRQLEKRLFNPLGMANSYLEHYQPPRGQKPLSHAFIGTLDLVDDVNTSFDWGGGGIVSTCEELNGFFRARLGGKLFRRRSTLERMLTAAERGRDGSDYDYGLGIMKRSIHGMTFYGHGGAYDCDAFYCPEKNNSVVTSLNPMNTHGKRDQFLQQAIAFIR